MKDTIRQLCLVLLCCGTTGFFVACGSDDGDDPGPTPDVVGDTDVDPGDTDVDPGDTDVIPGDTDVTPPPPTCSQHRASCQAASQSNDDFICDEGLGLCLQRCEAAIEDLDSPQCPLRSVCVALQGATPTEDFDEPGACLPGDCEGTFFNNNCAATQNCLPIGNDASFCIDAGTRAEGETCSAEAGCSRGLFCVNGTCETPCNRANGNADCESGEQCLDALRSAGANRPGICRVGCEAFSGGQCPEGEQCTPYGNTRIRAWGCEEVGGTLVGEGESCSQTINCEEGTLCVNEGSTEQPDLRCRRICSPTGEGGTFATCGSGEEGEPTELIGFTAFGTASGYVAVPAGTYTLQARTADAFLLAASVTVAEGTVASIFAIADAAGDLAALPLSDSAAALDAGDAGLRALHAAGDAPAVDVTSYTILESALSFGQTFGPVVLPLGEATSLPLALIAGDAIALAGDAPVAAGTASTLIAYAGAEGLALGALSHDLPVELSGSAALRIVHAAVGAGAVDVYAQSCEDVEGERVCGEPALLAADVAEENFATAAHLIVDAGDYEIWIFAAGADIEDEGTEPVLVTSALLGAGQAVTAVAVLAEGLDLLVIEDRTAGLAEGEGSVVALHANAAAPAVEVATFGTLAEGLAFGESLSGPDGAFLALGAGAYRVALSAGGEQIFFSGALTLEEGTLTTVVFAGSVADETFGPFLIVDDEAATTSAGQGAARFVHAVAGAPEVRITLPGEAGGARVCPQSNLQGLGFCRDGCAPFSGGEAGCPGDTDACIPFLTPGDRTWPDQGFCLERDGETFPAEGEACEQSGSLLACDAGICVQVSETEGDNECTGFCRPFTAGDCSEGAFCSPGPIFNGFDEFSLCIGGENIVTGVDPGASCPAGAAGRICGDFAACLQTSQMDTNGTCLKFCRALPGFQDCPNNQGCRNISDLVPGVPSYLGICGL